MSYISTRPAVGEYISTGGLFDFMDPLVNAVSNLGTSVVSTLVGYELRKDQNGDLMAVGTSPEVTAKFKALQTSINAGLAMTHSPTLAVDGRIGINTSNAWLFLNNEPYSLAQANDDLIKSMAAGPAGYVTSVNDIVAIWREHGGSSSSEVAAKTNTPLNVKNPALVAGIAQSALFLPGLVALGGLGAWKLGLFGKAKRKKTSRRRR